MNQRDKETFYIAAEKGNQGDKISQKSTFSKTPIVGLMGPDHWKKLKRVLFLLTGLH